MKRSQILILVLIIAIGFFFRTYQVVERADFGHDADLYSWIVKDIVVNGHLRLVGQETSASGIFIGPFFYYSLVPFFLIFNMDPVAAHIPITIFGILTVISYYFVFSKLFNTKVGIISSLLYAVLISTAVWFDRRLAPSTPTNLWTIWYFYTVIMLARGKFNVLPLLGILTGLIWHIHIALLPSLFAIPFALWQAKKLPARAQMIKFSIALVITSLPLIIFELRHGFAQTAGLLQNFTTPREGAKGFYKFQTVLEMIAKNLNSLFFAPQSINHGTILLHKIKLTGNILFPFAILASSLLLIKKKLLAIYELIPLLAWFFGVVLFFSVSSSPISEYYFYNTEIIFLTIVSLLIFNLFKSSLLGKILVFGILIFVMVKNAFFLIVQDTYHKGYLEKKAVVDYIMADAKLKNFPCFSLNYITSPGENVGFRYFFFLKKTHIAVPGRGSPVYSIVIPDEYALKEVKVKFGHIGIIPPKESPPKELMADACSGQNTNLTDPMFGYVE